MNARIVVLAIPVAKVMSDVPVKMIATNLCHLKNRETNIKAHLVELLPKNR